MRARWVYLGFWVMVPSLLLDAAIYPALMSALERAARGEYVIDDLAGLEDFSRFVSFCTILGLLLTGIGFLAWLSRLTDNAPWLGVGMPSISPRGAILWWFVPVASFMKPYQSVSELQRRLAPDDAERRRRGRLVIAWWLAYLGGSILREIATVLIARADDFTTEKIAGPLTVALAGDLVWAASAVLTVVMVRRMERDAATRAEALGYRREDELAVAFPGPAPAWYAQSVAWSAPPPARPGPWYAQPAVATGSFPSADTAPPPPHPGPVPWQPVPRFCPGCGSPRSGPMPFCGMCGVRLA